MLSQTEENYLKVIYKYSQSDNKAVNTNTIAAEFNISAASVTDMIKRLSEKEFLQYQKYRGVALTELGESTVKKIIRKQRLWKVFLAEWLHFSWDEVGEITEQLEHIKSEELVNRLEIFLNYPKFDPIGAPIPDEEGNFPFRKQLLLNELDVDNGGIFVATTNDSSDFLQYLNNNNLAIGTRIMVKEISNLDQSKLLTINDENELLLADSVAKQLIIKPFRIK